MSSPNWRYTPFPKPVQPPDAMSGGFVCRTFDRKWLPYLLGVAVTLAQRETWASEKDRAIDEAQNLITDLMLDNCEGGFPEGDGDCMAYPLTSWFVNFAPQDPYRQPEFVPTGYNYPPLYTVTPISPLLAFGLQVGDVVTDLTRFPPGSLPTIIPPGGLPRLRVRLSGTGTLELHLVKVPFGGMALIQRDGELTTISRISLNLDTIAIPPETDPAIVTEVTFDTPGDHVVDVTLIPWVQDALPPVLYGGGIRKIVLCGFDQSGVDMPAPQFQVDDCLLQYRPNDGAEWQTLVDLTDCTAGSAPTTYRVTDCGVIQYSVDGGVNWLDLADMSNCFPWKAPDSQARNRVQASGNFPLFTWKYAPGQTADLFQIEDSDGSEQFKIDRYNIWRWRNVFSSGHDLQIGHGAIGWGASKTPGNAVLQTDDPNWHYWFDYVPQSDAKLYFYRSYYGGPVTPFMTFEGNGKIRMYDWLTKNGGNFSLADTVFQTNATNKPTTANELLSGQTADLHINFDAVTNPLSGVDKYGFYFMRAVSGLPGFSDAKAGALAVDTAAGKVYAKYLSGWAEIGASGASGITDVEIVIAACDAPPNAVVTDNTLTLTLPETACPIEPEVTRFYHKEKTRPAPGQTASLEFIVGAGEYVALPWQIEAGDSIIAGVYDGNWTDDDYDDLDPIHIRKFYEGDGRLMYSGTPGTYEYNPLDVVDTEPHMSLILGYYDAVDSAMHYAGLGDALAIESVDPTVPYAVMFPNTAQGQRRGAVHVLVVITANNITLVDGTFTRFQYDVNCNAGWSGIMAASGFGAPIEICGDGKYRFEIEFYTDTAGSAPLPTYMTLLPGQTSNSPGLTDSGASTWIDAAGASHSGIAPVNTPVRKAYYESTTDFAYQAGFKHEV